MVSKNKITIKEMGFFDWFKTGDKDALRAERKVRQDVQYKKDGSMQHHRGHRLYSYNTNTGEIKEAVINKEVSIGWNGKAKYENKVVKEKGCVYVEALNKQNALKRVKRDLGIDISKFWKKI